MSSKLNVGLTLMAYDRVVDNATFIIYKTAIATQ